MDARSLKGLLDLGANVAWPIAFLSLFSEHFTPVHGLLLALVGPLAAALGGIAVRRKIGGLSALALVGVGLSGGIGLLQVDARWFAVKEAVLPALMGAAVAASVRTPYPVVRTVLWEALDGARVDAILTEKGETAAFAKTMSTGTVRFGLLLAASGVVSAALAAVMVTAAAGTPEYNSEVGRYTAWSFGLVNLPSMGGLVWVLSTVLTDLERRTGLTADDLMGAPKETT